MRTAAGSAADIQAAAVGGNCRVAVMAVMAFFAAAGVPAPCLRAAGAAGARGWTLPRSCDGRDGFFCRSGSTRNLLALRQQHSEQIKLLPYLQHLAMQN